MNSHRWVLVRATGNGSLDEPIGGEYPTRELAVAMAKRLFGIFALWLEEDGKLVAGTWAEIDGGRCFDHPSIDIDAGVCARCGE